MRGKETFSWVTYKEPTSIAGQPTSYNQNCINTGISSVVYWSEFLAANAEVPGSIPGATKFAE
jgi:hypothetical protein